MSERVEVVYALPERQRVISLEYTAGMTVGDALRLSRIGAEFPELTTRRLTIGEFVFGSIINAPIFTSTSMFELQEMNDRKTRQIVNSILLQLSGH